MAPPPKVATTLRRASSLSKVSTPSATAATSSPPLTRPGKSPKPSKIVRLPLSTKLLARWPHGKTIRKASQAKASPLSQSTIAVLHEPSPSTPIKSEADVKSIPKDKAKQVSPVKDIKAESNIDITNASKPVADSVIEACDKDKAKANPRKRPRLDPNKPDGRTAAAKAAKGAAGITTVGHKLGPKANQGAINAGLRALDRTGKPCRRWEKTGFRLKSFTGRAWELPSWRAPTLRAFGSESETLTSNSQSKENSSSNIGSDKSPAILPSNVASSPANGVATPV